MLLKFKFTSLLLFFTVGFTSCNDKETLSKPNIIIVYMDDLGYGDVSYNGAVKLQTPNMDCLLYTSPSPRDQRGARMPSSA